jgi:hypothetical protein
MIKRSQSVFVVFICLIIPSSIVGQNSDKTRKYSNEYLNIGIGARALGMSNSSVVSANDVTAGYWNPTGLLDIQSNLQVGLMHSAYFGGIFNYDYGALATKVDSNTAIGVSVIRLGVDNIPYTADLFDEEGNVDYNRITTFSASDYGFIFSYAKRLKIPGLKLGGNAKIIHRRAGDFLTAWGFGLDGALKYDYKKWNFALMARDVTTTYTAFNYNISEDMAEDLIKAGNEVPDESSVEITLPRFIFGVARKHTFKDKFTVLGELDIDMTTDGQRNTLITSKTVSLDPHIGFEGGYSEVVFLRAGVGNIQKVKNDSGSEKNYTFQPNIGVGIKLKNLTVDYAFTDVGDQSTALYSHVFSLKLDFYK